MADRFTGLVVDTRDALDAVDSKVDDNFQKIEGLFASSYIVLT